MYVIKLLWGYDGLHTLHEWYKQEMNAESWWRNLNNNLEQWRHRRITSRWKYVAKIRGIWNWYRITYGGGFGISNVEFLHIAATELLRFSLSRITSYMSQLHIHPIIIMHIHLILWKKNRTYLVRNVDITYVSGMNKEWIKWILCSPCVNENCFWHHNVHKPIMQKNSVRLATHLDHLHIKTCWRNSRTI